MRVPSKTEPSRSNNSAMLAKCWCCERTFGEAGVRQMRANREWLGYQEGAEVPRSGICEDCAVQLNACHRCGRAPVLVTDPDPDPDLFPIHLAYFNPYIWTQALLDKDEARLQAAGLGELAQYCETCVVRDHLMDDDLFETAPSREVAVGLAVIMARHWGISYYAKKKGLPIPVDEMERVERVEQLAALVCHTLINWPKTLEFVVAEAGLNPAFRRALGMFAETFEGQEHPMPPLLKKWVKDRDAKKLPRQRSNKPVDKHGNVLVTLILLHISNCRWILKSGMKPTSSRKTSAAKRRSFCSAVVQGLEEAGYTKAYATVVKVWERNIVKVE